MNRDERWEAFKKGDRLAFEEIYRRYSAVLLDYGSNISQDKSLVEDSVQDLFIELWRSRKTISSTTSIKFYLFKALRFKIYRNRDHGKFQWTESIDNHLFKFRSSNQEQNMIELEVQSEQMRHLREILENLPGRQIEAINLRYFHNFSNEEIATIMGINYLSACKLIYAGIKHLKENLRMSVMSIGAVIGLLL